MKNKDKTTKKNGILKRAFQWLKSYSRYAILSLIFTIVVACVFVAMCKNIDNSNVITITSAIISIMGGALASVVVAWLLEISNRKSQANRSKQAIEHILHNFDINVLVLMNHILGQCAKNNEEFDIDKQYSLDEVIAEIEKPSFKKWIFHIILNSVGTEIEKIDITAFLFLDQGEFGKSLFKEFSSLKSIINITKISDNEEFNKEMSETLGVVIVNSIKNIYETRGITKKFTISDTDKNYTIKFREAKKRNKENNDVPN